MKKVLFGIAQFLLFLLFVVVSSSVAQFFLSIWIHFHLRWFISHPTPTTIRYFEPMGLIYMTAIYLVVLAIEAMAKKLRTAGLWTTVAYVLALIVGLVEKFGWATHDLY
jgi:hypothetical protein